MHKTNVLHYDVYHIIR